MNDKIKVSVIMPCYNHEKYIKKAIESVVDQKTDFRYEIIIHDDASTDKSVEIIHKYEKKYPNLIRCIYQEENKYQKNIDIVREYLYPAVRGEYIAVCECDDYWISNEKLQKQVDILEKRKDVIACSHNCVIVNDENNVIGNSYSVYHYLKTHVFDLWRFECGLFPGQIAALMYRTNSLKFKSLEQENDYYNMRCQGDQKLVLHLLLNGDIYYLEDEMSAHRVVYSTGTSWTARTNKRDMALYMFNASRDLRRYARKYYNIVLHNHYVTFHRGLHIIIKGMNPRSFDEKQDYAKMIKECGSVGRAVAYILIMGIRSFPVFLVEKAQKNKYDKL